MFESQDAAAAALSQEVLAAESLPLKGPPITLGSPVVRWLRGPLPRIGLQGRHRHARRPGNVLELPLKPDNLTAGDLKLGLGRREL